jgi:hypothetical protein
VATVVTPVFSSLHLLYTLEHIHSVEIVLKLKTNHRMQMVICCCVLCVVQGSKAPSSGVMNKYMCQYQAMTDFKEYYSTPVVSCSRKIPVI